MYRNEEANYKEPIIIINESKEDGKLKENYLHREYPWGQ